MAKNEAERKVTDFCLEHTKVTVGGKFTGHIQTLFYNKAHKLCAIVEDDAGNLEIVIDVSEGQIDGHK